MFRGKNVYIFLAVFLMVLVLRSFIQEGPDFAGTMTGHLIGIAGTLLIFSVLQYPFKKRIMKRKGKSNPLNKHISYGLIGPSLVVIHSAHTHGSPIGILCFFAMVFLVLSGIVGMFLFQRISRTVKEQTKDLNALRRFFKSHRNDMVFCRNYFDMEPNGSSRQTVNEETGETITEQIVKDRCDEMVNLAHSIAETEYSLLVFDKTKTIFSKWIYAHYILAAFLFSMIIIHVLNALYYGVRWL
ncbi:MAG: hypothetical protein JW932_06090 [Deltaproteobacteria bacterium]|nr:hypothetical protein [Deltaproteobacteria bacterium]